MRMPWCVPRWHYPPFFLTDHRDSWMPIGRGWQGKRQIGWYGSRNHTKRSDNEPWCQSRLYSIQINPIWGIERKYFWSKRSFQPKYRGKSLLRSVLDISSLSENNSGICLSIKNLDQALANLSTLAVQHYRMTTLIPLVPGAALCPYQFCSGLL